MDQQNNLPSNIDIINVLKNSNLTPSQKVSVITEINNKNQPSKNLSHVPCKFFRQGACQAGNSCPFSHSIDLSNDVQPCKYFQKGNCKFGIKCALAHVMPDGKKINTKISQPSFSCHNLSPKNKNQIKMQNNPNSNTSKNYNNDSTPSDIINTIEPININNYYNQNNYSTPTNQLSNQNQFIVNNQVQPLNYNNYLYSNQFIPSDNPVQSAATTQTISQNTTMATSPFNNMSIWSSNSYSESPNQINNQFNNQFIRSLSFPNNNINNTININNNNNNPNMNMIPVPSISNSSFNQSFSSPSQLIFSPPISSSNNQTFSTIVDSAILDSETEGSDNEDENENENEKIIGNDNNINNNLSEDIDYVPSVLNDLLTPQEVKRRNSRSSFNSQNMGFSMSTIKDVYNLIEEDTPFVMD